MDVMIKKCFVSIGTAGKFYQHDGEGGIELFLKKQKRINSGGGGRHPGVDGGLALHILRTIVH